MSKITERLRLIARLCALDKSGTVTAEKFAETEGLKVRRSRKVIATMIKHGLLEQEDAIFTGLKGRPPLTYKVTQKGRDLIDQSPASEEKERLP